MNEKDFFPIGSQVNVTAKTDDIFIYDFTGCVVGYHSDFIIVCDQDGDRWDCEPNQLKHSSDSIMHDEN